MSDANAYILGTEVAELHRLGFQHQIWSSEARQGWQNGGFTDGQDILDLGSGPGFCSTELAYLVGQKGSVHAIDKSEDFISYLKSWADLAKLKNLSGTVQDFADLDLKTDHYDRIYHRWSLAWIDKVEEVISKLVSSLKPGGRIVSHEYFDWSTFQLEPQTPGIQEGIRAALKSWDDMDGNINIGRKLPEMFERAGLKVVSTRLMTKMATPKSMNWHWPKSFFNIYLPKLVKRGFLTNEGKNLALKEFDDLEQSNVTLFCPTLIEVITEKT